MGHVAAGLNQDTGFTGMKNSEMVCFWIHLIGRVMTMGSIIILVQRYNITITVTIHIGGVRINTCHRSSRKKILLHLMEKRRSHKMQKLGCLVLSLPKTTLDCLQN